MNERLWSWARRGGLAITASAALTVFGREPARTVRRSPLSLDAGAPAPRRHGPPSPALRPLSRRSCRSGRLPSGPSPIPTDAAAAPRGSGLDDPTSSAWPGVVRWDDRMERDWSAFIARLGRAVESRRCNRLDRCLRDPEANSLWDAQTDARLRLDDIDCADLPYILRAYYSYKRRLPFGFVSNVRSAQQTDTRYALGLRPTRWSSWRDYRTPRAVFHKVVELVHSGMYRTTAEVQDGDFYPVAVRPGALRPGSIYYDPNGHVLVVSEVRPDGVVHLIDGHPDGGLTWKRFGPRYAIGTARVGGGFKNFRPQRIDGRYVVRARDSELTDIDSRSQWDPSAWVANGQPVSFHDWVRAALAVPGAPRDPESDYREMVGSLCRDIVDRVDAVDLARTAGLHLRPHPNYLPWNIYGTNGDWETWSTPSRDAALKVVLRDLRDTAAAQPPGSPLRAAFARAWSEEIAKPGCHFRYINSAGAPVELTVDDVLDRLFTMSFDPYHCPELRWGAPEGSPERATCVDDPVRRAWYRAEQRLRNRVDRVYGVATPVTFGPETPPDVDPRPVLGVR
ncbi:MAG: hypothetical protein IPF99_11500 [Deltaproteobacteria bacterium]|nr:hypothetical protein [Deltaproteobacteria bacterium]